MMIRRALSAAVACVLFASAAMAQVRIADIRQGTNMALALAPDGETLVVDLLGGLWRLPASGGGAEPLIPAGEDVHHPRFDPGGSTLVYQKLVEGQWDLWLFDVGTRRQTPLTSTQYDEREPDFSADGRSIVFAANPDGRFSLWALALASGTLTRLTNEPGDSSFPVVSDRSEIAYINHQAGEWTLRLLGRGANGAELTRTSNALSAPSWRPGGGVLVYSERDGRRMSWLKLLLIADELVIKTLVQGEDVFTTRAAWRSPAEYMYTADGQIWRRGIAQLTRDPVHLFAGVAVDGSPRTPVAQVLDRPGPHAAAGLSGVTVSPDGRRSAFTALGDLWLAEQRNARRLTDDPYVDVDPDFTPDGEAVVFASDRGGTMALWHLNLATGALSQLTRETGKAYLPKVDPTGRYAAYLHTDGFGPWSASALRIVTLDASSNTRTIAEGLRDVGELGWDHRDGGWRITVGTLPRGPTEERQVSSFDAGVRGGAAAQNPAPETAVSPELEGGSLEWSPSAPAAPYVVQVGRLFDGIRNDYRHHVDVHVEGQRISAIVGRGRRALPATVIDARDATVIPGLIDVHVHQSSLSGERLGRIWLAHGVTTVRELTGDVAAALERAESWASGRRLGPRLIVTPELDATNRDVTPAPASPIVVRSYGRLAGGVAHSLLRQRRQFRIAVLPELTLLESISRARYSRGAHEITISPLNRSYQDSLGTVIESGTFVSTSLAALAGGGLESGGERGRALRQLYSSSELRRWAPAPEGGSSTLLRPLQNTMARLVRSGGHAPTGTDAPAVPYGHGLHMELEMLADAGIAPAQILRLATAEGALALGLDRQLGTLEQGKLADFVVVDGDPLVSISDARSVTAVVKGGVWHTQSELLERP
ncbi:amidohydrolase family protein [Candidatus Rariloculus sp.]|uniref:amidohydrolase family protein n=1 Tax=Candidatus Rariloculus sp. TaxID=3101265 RepID=UPI003D108C7E